MIVFMEKIKKTILFISYKQMMKNKFSYFNIMKPMGAKNEKYPDNFRNINHYKSCNRYY